MPRFWLLKCEPEVYSISDLARDRSTGWDSVRNYQVRNFMRDDMKPGDLGIFYHSNAEPSGAAGVLRIVRPAVADPTQFDPKSEYHDPKSDRAAPTWLMCEVAFVEAFAEVVPLEALRADPALEGMQILRRGNRLSITPLEEAEFERILALGRASGGVRTSAPRAKSGSARKSRLAGKSR
jgi:predicted RNA-binding protein with PUA-like domain